MLTNSVNYKVQHIYHPPVFLFRQGFERMSKIQKHSIEELVDKAKADTKLEMDGGVVGTMLRM